MCTAPKLVTRTSRVGLTNVVHPTILVHMNPTHTDLIASADAAQALGINRSTLSRWVRDGRITPELRGTGLRGPMWFKRSDVERLADEAAAA